MKMSKMVRSNPGRPRNQLRKTPRLDAWIAQLFRELGTPGAKTDLAKHLSDGDDASIPRWRTAIGKIARRETLPGGEFVLAAQEWLAARRAR